MSIRNFNHATTYRTQLLKFGWLMNSVQSRTVDDINPAFPIIGNLP